MPLTSIKIFLIRKEQRAAVRSPHAGQTLSPESQPCVLSVNTLPTHDCQSVGRHRGTLDKRWHGGCFELFPLLPTVRKRPTRQHQQHRLLNRYAL